MILSLETYEKASGQVLNKEKTSIFFSTNTPQDVKDTIIKIVEVKANGCFEKYLGQPTCLGRNKAKHFQYLLDRTWNRLSNWKAKFLSGVGKEILLKDFLQAISTYTIAIFLLPKTITFSRNEIFKKFWWR